MSNTGDVHETLETRGRTHGDYPTQAAFADALRTLFASAGNWGLMTPVERDAALMTAVKLSRILIGNPHERDHWHDIAGYTTLVVKHLDTQREKTATLLRTKAKE